MNQTSPFIFNGNIYYPGTIVKIKEECRQFVGFSSMLKFTGYIVDERVYCFSSLYDTWNVYKMSSKQISEYIKSISSKGEARHNEKKVNPEYIEGIVSAWIWYILAMFFFMFAKELGNVITGWCFATFIFFRWRHKKIKGG